MQCCPRSLGAMSLCPPSIQKMVQAEPPHPPSTPRLTTLRRLSQVCFDILGKLPSHQFPCLVCWGSLCIFTFVCFASTVPRPYLCSQVKMSWDAKLPEASFPSVLILLHTAPWLCSPHSFNLCLLIIKLACFSLRHGIPYPDSMEAQKPELPRARWFPLSDFFFFFLKQV